MKKLIVLPSKLGKNACTKIARRIAYFQHNTIDSATISKIVTSMNCGGSYKFKAPFAILITDKSFKFIGSVNQFGAFISNGDIHSSNIEVIDYHDFIKAKPWIEKNSLKNGDKVTHKNFPMIEFTFKKI